MAKHTPGPWHQSKLIHSIGIYADHEHAFDIAKVYDGGTSEFEANAALICAAPDLLKAIENLLLVIEHGRIMRPDAYPIVDCRAAIAKARGTA